MSAPETLYHYCSPQAFVDIIRGRSIWLSSLTLSNDTMEGRLVSATVMRLAERDQLDARARESLQESLAFAERTFDGLGFCLSEDGDLLSQWRGYADDARGFAVGFSRQYLEALAASTLGKDSPGFALRKVEYLPEQHEALVQPTYAELRRLIDAGAFKFTGLRGLLDTRTPEQISEDDKKVESAHRALIFKILDFLPEFHRLKAPAFREEREWRLVSMLVGTDGETCSFRAASTRIIPYRSYALPALPMPSITEIVTGPRNETPAKVLELLVRQAGFSEARIRHSEATYR